MNQQEMVLNIRYDLPSEIWNIKIPEIYEDTQGWLCFATYGSNEGIPYWFSFNEEEKHVMASVEPAGLQIMGLMDNDEWELWKKQFKGIATQRLGFKVGEVALGEVDE